ncbi:MAG: potassium channel protein [Bacteroidales bacterium]|nr:potassium channel protein [Bacteroidales bacterium]
MFKTGQNLNLIIALSLLLLIGFTGIAGYMAIEGYTLLEASYMTVITVATVGFKEVHPLSDPGKVFTIILIIFSFSIFAYSLSTITSYLVEGRIKEFFKNNRKTGGITKMKDHIIIVGFGRNGQQTAHDLLLLNKKVVIIEKSHELIVAHEKEKVIFVEGDATEDEILEMAGIQKAGALISTLPIDADNLYVVLTARSLNAGLQIISRASHDSSERKLITAGASHVVMPEKVGGTFMASLVAKPDLAEFFHHLSIEGNEGVNLVEVVCSDLPSEFQDRTIHDMSIRRLTGANIVGFRTPEGQYIINPPGETVMAKNAKLFVLGTPDQIENVKEIIRQKHKH